MDILKENIRFKIIDNFIEHFSLINHHIQSYNKFIQSYLFDIVNNEKNIIFENEQGEIVQINPINIFVIKPMYENKPLYPYMAREKNLTYNASIFLEVEIIIDNSQKSSQRVEIAKIPVMVQSCICHLSELSESEKIKYKEMKWDKGGYFIINGIERFIVGQLKNAYNKIICTMKDGVYLCETRSFSYETLHSANIEIKYKNNCFYIKFQKKFIPLKTFLDTNFKEFLTFFNDPEEIFNNDILLLEDENNECQSEDEDDDKESNEESNEESNNKFIFPHLYHLDYKKHLLFLSQMVKKIILIKNKKQNLDNKDNFSNKRVEYSGLLFAYLFQILYKKFIISCQERFKIIKKLDLSFLREKQDITNGFQYSMSTGNWGAKNNKYIKSGVSQIIDKRISIMPILSILRRFTIPQSSNSQNKNQNFKQRQLNPTSIFFACPSETPEGQNVGLSLQLAILTLISDNHSQITIEEIIIDNLKSLLTEYDKNNYILYINGYIINFMKEHNIDQFIKLFRKLKINKKIPHHCSVYVDSLLKEIHINSDGGRFMRPLINLEILKYKKPECLDINYLLDNNFITIFDGYEIENTEIAMNPIEYEKYPEYKYMEIHPYTMLGIMAAKIPFSEHTQSPRICYQTSMEKQAIGKLESFNFRRDNLYKTSLYSQKALIQTQIFKHLGINNYPNGINAIVALACYTGFNQEDSIIINKSALERGMFNISCHKTYSYEEKDLRDNYSEKITIPEKELLLNHCDYSKLDDDGVIKKNSVLKINDIIISKIIINKTIITHSPIMAQEKDVGKKIIEVLKWRENSILNVKITTTDFKIPEVGDKLCSSFGQKGTIGIVLPTEDMPFTSKGIVPDIIINPHCIPGRMTINQLIACITGIFCCEELFDVFDATPFQDKYQKNGKVDFLQNILKKINFIEGKEKMFNGYTGEYIGLVTIGPVYYHILDHFVSEKMYSRIQNNNNFELTRQPVAGRNNKGGLRLGEMEKDNLLAHGISRFINEKMFENSDYYKMRICDNCKDFSLIKKSLLKKDNNEQYNCEFCNNLFSLSEECPVCKNCEKNIFNSENFIYRCECNLEFSINYCFKCRKNIEYKYKNVNFKCLICNSNRTTICNIPYSAKLLLQMLNANNIKTEIYTD